MTSKLQDRANAAKQATSGKPTADDDDDTEEEKKGGGGSDASPAKSTAGSSSGFVGRKTDAEVRELETANMLQAAEIDGKHFVYRFFVTEIDAESAF